MWEADGLMRRVNADEDDDRRAIGGRSKFQIASVCVNQVFSTQEAGRRDMRCISAKEKTLLKILESYPMFSKRSSVASWDVKRQTEAELAASTTTSKNIIINSMEMYYPSA